MSLRWDVYERVLARHWRAARRGLGPADGLLPAEVVWPREAWPPPPTVDHPIGPDGLVELGARERVMLRAAALARPRARRPAVELDRCAVALLGAPLVHAWIEQVERAGLTLRAERVARAIGAVVLGSLGPESADRFPSGARRGVANASYARLAAMAQVPAWYVQRAVRALVGAGLLWRSPTARLQLLTPRLDGVPVDALEERGPFRFRIERARTALPPLAVADRVVDLAGQDRIPAGLLYFDRTTDDGSGDWTAWDGPTTEEVLRC